MKLSKLTPIKDKTKYQKINLFKHHFFQTYSASKQVLLLMLKVGGAIYLGPYKMYYEQRWGKYENKRFSNGFYNLEKRGLVKKTKQSGQTLYRLTEAGRLQAEKLAMVFKYLDTKWDGRWRLVIFDIPENKKVLREGLRRTLKELGFIKLQASVWVIPYDIFDDLAKLIPDIKKHDWIRLIETDRIINDKDIYKKFFGRQEED